MLSYHKVPRSTLMLDYPRSFPGSNGHLAIYPTTPPSSFDQHINSTQPVIERGTTKTIEDCHFFVERLITGGTDDGGHCFDADIPGMFVNCIYYHLTCINFVNILQKDER